MQPSLIETFAAIFFALAVIHTLSANHFRRHAESYPEGSIGENFFHLIGEVEVVFGLWAAAFIMLMAALVGASEAIRYAEGRNFTEPLFVFAIMAIAATRPIIEFARRIILFAARGLPFKSEAAVFCACLFIGPLLGSFITEPAAMTVTALILRERYFRGQISEKFKYVLLATLFVNISIGGVLTPYAAPPVLMVAAKWKWDLSFMLINFGWKSIIAVGLNTFVAWFVLRRELVTLKITPESSALHSTPGWLTLVHLIFLVMVILTAHHPVIFIGLLLLFLGVAAITAEYQDELALKQSLLVAFFLGGVVVLGGLQAWWLDPILRGLPDWALFLGTTGLTAFADNAALTYLGSQIEGISDAFKLSLMGGAIAGGGLTVIANAPNPAGYAILQDGFGAVGISPMKLFLYALIPTAISVLLFWPY